MSFGVCKMCIRDRDYSEKKMYKAKLHDGEVEVMILAQEKKADLVIIDDNAAKKTAKYLGLTVTGTLGVLIKAKHQGIINEVRPFLSKMRANGFYVRDADVYKRQVVPQYEHIFGEEENAGRLPERVRNSTMRVQLFDGALRQTRRMLEADYKTAIPRYYNHGMQLLIPICLQSPGKPDLALACMKTADGSRYLGRTCLTLKMAYHNARLLARLDLSLIHI